MMSGEQLKRLANSLRTMADISEEMAKDLDIMVSRLNWLEGEVDKTRDFKQRMLQVLQETI